MKRVLIIGCSGAGKSMAARALAERTGLPLIHLDRHYWLPGWQRPESDAWQATVAGLAARPEWIMDGNFGGTLSLRLAAADTVIHLDFPTRLCLWRVAKRTVALLGRQRGGDVPDGCPERFDWDFLRFVVRYRRTHRPRDLERLTAFDGSYHRFTDPGQLDAFLSTVAGRRTDEAPRGVP